MGQYFKASKMEDEEEKVKTAISSMMLRFGGAGPVSYLPTKKASLVLQLPKGKPLKKRKLQAASQRRPSSLLTTDCEQKSVIGSILTLCLVRTSLLQELLL